MADIWSEKDVGFIGHIKFLSDLTVGPTYFAKSGYTEMWSEENIDVPWHSYQNGNDKKNSMSELSYQSKGIYLVTIKSCQILNSNQSCSKIYCYVKSFIKIYQEKPCHKKCTCTNGSDIIGKFKLKHFKLTLKCTRIFFFLHDNNSLDVCLAKP